MTHVSFLSLGFVCTLTIITPTSVSGNTECPLTAQDFINGQEIDVPIERTDGRSFHETQVGQGNANYQGDIGLTPEQYEAIIEGKPLTQRTLDERALTLIGRWPRENGIVFFILIDMFRFKRAIFFKK